MFKAVKLCLSLRGLANGKEGKIHKNLQPTTEAALDNIFQSKLAQQLSAKRVSLNLVPTIRFQMRHGSVLDPVQP